jgi:hypothetical protein
MAKTYSVIQTYTLTANTSSVTFSNIPQNFTDLVLKFSAKTTYTSNFSDPIIASFNSSTSTFAGMYISTNGTTIYAGDYARQAGNASNTIATSTNTFGLSDLYIGSYTSSNHKSFSVDGVSENNNVGTDMVMNNGHWSTTDAITSITLTSQNSANFVSGSTFTLYGVGSGAKATGGTITGAGNYIYHTFTSTGSFIPSEKIRGAEVLLVAGGGGATGGGSAGGGAGGLIAHTSQSLTAGTPYRVVVGAGGSSGLTSDTSTSGSNSQFASLTAAVGGGRAPYRANGVSGGSGSGAPAANNTFSAGTGTSGQGNNGGTSVANYTGGGGGGAGAVGGNASTGFSGVGGAGSNTYSSWGLATGTGQLVGGFYYYAGGGGAGGQNVTSAINGLGGVGGGGNGARSDSVTGSSGVANTGGGAGGGWSGATDTAGGAGGSGIVIVRYPIN